MHQEYDYFPALFFSVFYSRLQLQQQSKEASALIGYNDAPLVSVDFNHRPESAIVDGTQTRVQGEMVQVVAWYDNEWGYANRLLDWVATLAESHQA